MCPARPSTPGKGTGGCGEVKHLVLLGDGLTILVPGPALLLIVPVHVDVVCARALPHVGKPAAGDRTLDRLVWELAPVQEGFVLLLKFVIVLFSFTGGDLAEVHHLVGVVEAIRLLGPAGSIHELDDHARNVVAAVLCKCLVHQLSSHHPEVGLVVLLQVRPHDVRHLVVGHDVPQAVAGEDDYGALDEVVSLVDFWDAGHLLHRRGLVHGLLVLEVTHAAADGQVAIQSGWVVRGDKAHRRLDALLLGEVVRLVVDACGMKGPQRRVFDQVPGPPHRDLRRRRLRLLGGRRDDETAGVAAVADLHGVESVLVLGNERSDHCRARVLVRMARDVASELLVHIFEAL
mmetsp:Transcript_29557/g.97901  ORF Transcript_29557/g.97901 Transcript_29557/m.97901 type:complete len:346 (-) Transcript_29557:358-1395(-)